MFVCLDEAVDDSSVLVICIDVKIEFYLPFFHDPAGDQCAILVLLRSSPAHTGAIPVEPC